MRKNKIKIFLLFIIMFGFALKFNTISDATEIKSGSIDLSDTETEWIDFRTYQPGIIVIDLDVSLANGGCTSSDRFTLELSQSLSTDVIERDEIVLPGGYCGETFQGQWYCPRTLDPGSYLYTFDNNSVHDLYIKYTVCIYPSIATELKFCTDTVNMMDEETRVIKYYTIPTNSYDAMYNVISTNNKVAEAYWDRNGVRIVANGAGSCYIEIIAANGSKSRLKVVVKNPSQPKLIYTSYKMCKGETIQNSLKYNTKSVKWSTSNKKIATVSKTGKITAKGIGKATITAKVGNKKYTCRITVVQQEPDFYAVLFEYNTRNNYFEVDFYNNSNKPLTIYSSGSKVMHVKYKSYDRNLKFKKGSSVTIKPYKSVTVRFYVKGRVTWYDYSRYTLQYKFKFDGKTYTGRVWDEDSVYKNKSWQDTYWDYEAYEYWMWG